MTIHKPTHFYYIISITPISWTRFKVQYLITQAFHILQRITKVYSKHQHRKFYIVFLKQYTHKMEHAKMWKWSPAATYPYIGFRRVLCLHPDLKVINIIGWAQQLSEKNNKYVYNNYLYLLKYILMITNIICTIFVYF